MKVILTQDVTSLGKSGDLKDVADGYARNFLIPRKLAVPAAGGAYRAWQHDIASREEKRKREREEAEIAAQRISSTTLTMGVKVGEGGKLYGSITAKDIADALGRRGIEIDRHKVDLAEPLKAQGMYFIECIEKNQPPVKADAQKGMDVVETLCAIQESIDKDGKRIKI